MPSIPTYPYPLPKATPIHVTKMKNLFEQKYGVNLTQQESKELLELLMSLVYLTQLQALNTLHDAVHPLREKVL
jgi:hypothetical protein